MAEEKKRRRGRYAYLDDYQKNEKGGYEYQGDYYQWMISEKEEKTTRIEFRIFSVVALALVFICGCIPAPGMNYQPVMILFYAIEMIASFSVLMAVWRLCGEKNPMRGHIWKSSVNQLPFRTILEMVCAAVCAVAEIIFMIMKGISGLESILYGFLFSALQICVFVINLWIRRRGNVKKWEKITKNK